MVVLFAMGCGKGGDAGKGAVRESLTRLVPTELRRKPAPAESENGYPDYEKVATLVKVENTDEIRRLCKPDLSKAELAKAKQLLQAHASALAALESAIAKPRWRKRIDKGIETEFPELPVAKNQSICSHSGLMWRAKRTGLPMPRTTSSSPRPSRTGC